MKKSLFNSCTISAVGLALALPLTFVSMNSFATSSRNSSQSAIPAQTMDRLDQIETGNSVVSPKSFKLFDDKVQVGGLMNLDGYYSSDAYYTSVPSLYGFGAKDNSSIYLNNANFFLGGDVGIAHANLNIAYFDRPTLALRTVASTTTAIFSRQNMMTLDEAYVTLADFNRSPFYLKIGKTYTVFGQYHAYALVPTLTQLLSQVNGTGVEAGMVFPNGMYFKVDGYSASNNTTQEVGKNDVDDYSAKIGYLNMFGENTLSFEAAYLGDIRDLGYLNSADYQFPFAANNPSTVSSAGDWEFNLAIGAPRYDLSGQFVWIPDDVTLTRTGHAPVKMNNAWAGTILAGYHFSVMGQKSRFGVGFEFTQNAEDLLLPAHRYLVNYSTDITKNVNAMFAYYYDCAYKLTSYMPAQRIGDNSTFMLGLSVHF